MSSDEVNNFIMITGLDDPALANQFLEMAGNNVETAISLYFEHGGASLLNNNVSGNGNNGNDNADTNGEGGNQPVLNVDSDAELAKRLQNEAYNEPHSNDSDYVRPPDEARHETLAETHMFPGMYGGIGGAFQHLRQANDPSHIFDSSRPVGVFNQRFEAIDSDLASNSDSDSNSDVSIQEDNQNLYEYVEEPAIEIDEDGEVREYTKLVKKLRNITKEERLAMLFRPPFEIMSKINLDRAKNKSLKKKKWIMINIQDVGIFHCQALNRDLWSSRPVKKLIKKNFIFLQYQYDSQNAQQYIQYYNLQDKESLPHIAIIDPITGERLKQWNGSVPKVESFIEEIQEFLTNFSLDPSTVNPVVNEPPPKVDPTLLSEEQQMEFAIRQSMGLPTSQTAAPELTNASETIKDDSLEQNEITNNNDPSHTNTEDIFDTIEGVEHIEPPNRPGITTRIQIRMANGQKIVRRFNATEDTVRTVYEFIKHDLEEYATVHFTLSDHQRHDLIDKLDMTLDEAGLKNSSLLLEKIEDDE